MSDGSLNNAATPLCTHCAAPLDGLENFCSECGCPLTFQAASMPLESVYSQGFVWREGSLKPYKAIIPLGMWVWLGPGLLLMLWEFAETLRASRGVAWGPSSLGNAAAAIWALVLTGGGTLALGTLLFKTTRNYFRLRRAARVEDAAAEQEPSDAESPSGDESAE